MVQKLDWFTNLKFGHGVISDQTPSQSIGSMSKNYDTRIENGGKSWTKSIIRIKIPFSSSYSLDFHLVLGLSPLNPIWIQYKSSKSSKSNINPYKYNISMCKWFGLTSRHRPGPSRSAPRYPWRVPPTTSPLWGRNGSTCARCGTVRMMFFRMPEMPFRMVPSDVQMVLL